METEYPYFWQVKGILLFSENYHYHEEVIMLRYKYYWNRMKYWLCSNSNYDNTSAVSTHKSMLAANGRNIRIWRTRSVATRKMMLYPTCRLSPTWREASCDWRKGQDAWNCWNWHLRLTFNGQPTNKTEEQQLRMLGDLLKAMKLEERIKTDGRNWFLL